VHAVVLIHLDPNISHRSAVLERPSATTPLLSLLLYSIRGRNCHGARQRRTTTDLHPWLSSPAPIRAHLCSVSHNFDKPCQCTTFPVRLARISRDHNSACANSPGCEPRDNILGPLEPCSYASLHSRRGRGVRRRNSTSREHHISWQRHLPSRQHTPNRGWSESKLGDERRGSSIQV
jgi:hypothetical protein